MANRTTTFVSAVFAGVFACAALTTGAASSARAAEDCIAGPKDEAPQGSHWYYRVDRVTHRKCWYLWAEGLKVRQAASPKPSSSAMPALQQQAEIADLKSVADSHAEQLIAGPSADLPIAAHPTAPPPPEATAAAAGVNARSVNSRGWALSARWSDGPNSSGSAAHAPGLMSNAETDAPARLESSRLEPSQMVSPDEKPAVFTTARLAAPEAAVGSNRLLLAVFAAALALAALIGRVIFKYAAARRPGRRDSLDPGTAGNANVSDKSAAPVFSGSVAPAHHTRIVRGPPKSNDPKLNDSKLNDSKSNDSKSRDPSREMDDLRLLLRSFAEGQARGAG
jgi:hypothetical protein